MPVLIGRLTAAEEQKCGVLTENAAYVISAVSRFPSIKVMGLMTMGRNRRQEEAPLFCKNQRYSKY